MIENSHQRTSVPRDDNTVTEVELRSNLPGGKHYKTLKTNRDSNTEPATSSHLHSLHLLATPTWF